MKTRKNGCTSSVGLRAVLALRIHIYVLDRKRTGCAARFFRNTKRVQMNMKKLVVYLDSFLLVQKNYLLPLRNIVIHNVKWCDPPGPIKLSWTASGLKRLKHSNRKKLSCSLNRIVTDSLAPTCSVRYSVQAARSLARTYAEKPTGKGSILGLTSAPDNRFSRKCCDRRKGSFKERVHSWPPLTTARWCEWLITNTWQQLYDVRRKFRSLTSDNMESWKADQRSQVRRKKINTRVASLERRYWDEPWVC